MNEHDWLTAASGYDVVNLVRAKLREVGFAQRRFCGIDGKP